MTWPFERAVGSKGHFFTPHQVIGQNQTGWCESSHFFTNHSFPELMK